MNPLFSGGLNPRAHILPLAALVGSGFGDSEGFPGSD